MQIHRIKQIQIEVIDYLIDQCRRSMICVNGQVADNNKIMKKQEKQDGIIDGFSSDQQVKHEEIIVEERKKTEVQISHKEEVKFKIPPPQEIKAKSYSLNPDIATGWAPKNQLPVPIPMLFENRRIDAIVKRFLQKKQQKMRLSYLGPRFENTFYAWYDKEFEFPYGHIKAPHNMKFTNRAFCGQHWDAHDGLIFDSFFESGNLDLAVQVGERQYDIYMRVDSNTRGHLQWFNFKITNLQKLQKYKLNICNLQKNKSLYSRGQKPYIFSTKRFQKQKKGWQQGGDSVKFEQKPGKSAKVISCQFTSNCKLSFQYYTQYENDTVQIAYCVPYTYSQLLAELKNLENKVGAKQFFTISKLCQSLGGLDIPLLTIHQNFNKQAEIKMQNGSLDQSQIPKKCIIISGRVHPGESNGSHMMQGFLQFLCGESKQAKMLRQNFIFKIVPMLNPDGVTLGNYRTGISGRDFNREYRNPDKSIFPEVYAFKKFVIDNKSLYRENLLMFLDFHGHSTKKNVFVYGPEFPIIQRHYYECRVFPKLLGNHTNMFRYYSCSFKVSQFKQTTARAVFLRKVMIPLSYTIQASNGSFYDHNTLKDVPFSGATWIQMGKKIGTALAEYGELITLSQKYKIQKMQSRKAKRQIKIRKNSRGKSNPSSANQNFNTGQRQISILANSQNDKIKKLFQQIKQAESQKQLQKNQQDDISQGSSDGEGQKDDLSPQKLHLLFQIIKNKKANISEKHKKKFIQQDSKHAKTNQQQNQEGMGESKFELKPVQMVLPVQLEPDNRDDQIFKPNHAKGYFLRNRNKDVAYIHSEQKKQKVAARIINFSFIGHTRPMITNSVERNKAPSNASSNRVDIVQSNSLNKMERSTIIDGIQTKNKPNFRVLDLSDNNFRQTCVGPNINDTSNNLKGLIDRKNLTFFNVSPRKLGAARLEDYKYKRLFLDEYKI